MAAMSWWVASASAVYRARALENGPERGGNGQVPIASASPFRAASHRDLVEASRVQSR